MARVLLVQPWNHHDEGVVEHDLSREWRNGPYSLLLLATLLRSRGHDVGLLDMQRDLVMLRGNVKACLERLARAVKSKRPDIIGFGFFSIHWFEVRQALRVAREACARYRIPALFVAGGIHASTEPRKTLEQLGFDHAFVGEAERGLVALADGQPASEVPGLLASSGGRVGTAEQVEDLDSLPFPDWSQADYRFYATPSWAKLKLKKSASLDLIMGRGCVYKCAFCAYNALSSVRFHSAEYLADQMDFMAREYGVDGVTFTDSTIGNNRRLLEELCELLIRRGTAERLEWYGNIRPNQVNEKLLRLMWRAGCRYLLHGFESGSQRVLDLMVKGCRVEDNFKAAELHNRLRFPYHASMMLGYPGEREEDVRQTLDFLRRVRPPSVGINWYVPLPGSPDYDKLVDDGVICTDDPEEWRRIGEVNGTRVYADAPEAAFRELFAEAEHLAYVELPSAPLPAWKPHAVPGGEPEGRIALGRAGSQLGRLARRLLRAGC